ncbi:CinA family protein [Kerstersia sp.]|uniref:CinA family protein n=1 Tax=Kerstersia sp. TaxID=1930783 RepID=UPI003F8DDFBE
MESDKEVLEAVEALAAALKQRGWRLGTAESCTGGLLAAALTDLAGSSDWYHGGFVTYSNAEKIRQLGVADVSLEMHGAVSEQVASQMATGVLAVTRETQFAISTTGIAGPGGATPGKPVGMVCFGFARLCDDGVVVAAQTRLFDGDRAAVRRAAVLYALRAALPLVSAPCTASRA